MIELKAITEDEDEIEMAMTLGLKMVEPAAEYEQIWNAYDAVARLWHQTACSVAANCGFRYPEETEKDMKDFIQALRDGGFPEDD